MPHDVHTRRRFLSLLPGLCAAIGADAGRARAATGGRARWSPHPEPRPGIDASRVLPRDRVEPDPEVQEVFEMVRRIPQLVDGIRCHCGCADLPEKYSLLSCYEEDGMAQMCLVCQGEARLAFKLHRQGRALDQIRAAIDAEFG